MQKAAQTSKVLLFLKIIHFFSALMLAMLQYTLKKIDQEYTSS